MKRVFCVLSVALLVVSSIFTLQACSKISKPILSLDRVVVFIDQAHEELVETESLDFDFENIDTIRYNYLEVTRKLTLSCSNGAYNKSWTDQTVATLKSINFVKDAHFNSMLGIVRSFTITVKGEFYDNFDNELFQISDFEIPEANSLKYIHHSKTYFQDVTVTLKTQGQQEIIEAIEHFKTLPFVKGARPFIAEYTKPYPSFTHDLVLVVLTQAYTTREVLKPSDFSFDNTGSVVYMTTHYDDISGYPDHLKPGYRHILSILLIECSEQHVLQAISHIKDLPFVQSAEPNHIGEARGG